MSLFCRYLTRSSSCLAVLNRLDRSVDRCDTSMLSLSLKIANLSMNKNSTTSQKEEKEGSGRVGVPMQVEKPPSISESVQEQDSNQLSRSIITLDPNSEAVQNLEPISIDTHLPISSATSNPNLPTMTGPSESDCRGSDDVACDGGGSEVLPFTTEVIPEGMTRQQWKSVLRKQKRALRKEEAFLRRKERDRVKKEKRKLEKRKMKQLQDQTLSQPKAKKKKMSDESASGIRVAIDLGYSDLMSEKDCKKVMHQCQRCYSVNRRAEAPLQLYLTSFCNKTAQFWDNQCNSYRNWDVHREERGFVECFGKDNVVFLTSDSPNILNDLDPSKAYIIGGLVDHNHHKGYCYQKAVEKDLAHAQLPITNYVKLNCRTVLAINHVFEILLDFSITNDWEKAFYKAIPPRKVQDPKGDHNSSGSAADIKDDSAADLANDLEVVEGSAVDDKDPDVIERPSLAEHTGSKNKDNSESASDNEL